MSNFQNIKKTDFDHFKDFKNVKLFLSFYISARYCKKKIVSREKHFSLRVKGTGRRLASTCSRALLIGFYTGKKRHPTNEKTLVN